MTTVTMRRFRQRSAEQAAMIASAQGPALDLDALFGRRVPRRLEIGFGHGCFLSPMAAAHPDEDFLGVEREDLRVNKTAHKSLGLQATNIRLFEGSAEGFLQRLPSASLHRAYVLFPDPWPKRRHRRRRLLIRSTLLDLAWALAPGGRLVIASDCHAYAFQALANISTLPGLFHNLYAPQGYRFDIPTRFPTVFERHCKAAGCRVCYLMLERSMQCAPPRIILRGNRYRDRRDSACDCLTRP